jgi:hypothetical protein
MQTRPPSIDPSWYAFLVLAFAVVGLTGLFATYAAPIPLHRAIDREAALTAAAETTDPQALAALRPRLGDSADAVLAPGPDREARIAAERIAMRARLEREAAITATRLRWLIVIITLAAAVFGAVLLGVVGRQNRLNPAEDTSNTRER